MFTKEKWNFSWLKDWFKVGKFSGIESLLRNFVFMMMIVRMVNIVAEQGNYWIANSFIWNWLLIPGLALADLVKKEIGENTENIMAFEYSAMETVFTICDECSEYETVFGIVLLETGFYITFLFNSCICDSTFYGLGKTNYMLIQSLCIDGLYYGIMFILYLTGVFVPTLLGIALMFGIGMTLDFIPTLVLYIMILKKENIKLDFNLLPNKNCDNSGNATNK